MLLEGFKYMFIGMSVVFMFLSLLVLVMTYMGYFFERYSKYFPENIKETKKMKTVHDSNKDIAVVIAAVQSYLKN